MRRHLRKTYVAISVFITGFLLISLFLNDESFLAVFGPVGCRDCSYRHINVSDDVRTFYAHYGYAVEGIMPGKWAQLPILKAIKEQNCHEVEQPLRIIGYFCYLQWS